MHVPPTTKGTLNKYTKHYTHILSTLKALEEVVVMVVTVGAAGQPLSRTPGGRPEEGGEERGSAEGWGSAAFIFLEDGAPAFGLPSTARLLFLEL